jgi:hypothetical protein
MLASAILKKQPTAKTQNKQDAPDKNLFIFSLRAKKTAIRLAVGKLEKSINERPVGFRTHALLHGQRFPTIMRIGGIITTLKRRVD